MGPSNSGCNLCMSLFMPETILDAFFLLKKLCLISPGGRWWILNQHRSTPMASSPSESLRVSHNAASARLESHARELSSRENTK